MNLGLLGYHSAGTVLQILFIKAVELQNPIPRLWVSSTPPPTFPQLYHISSSHCFSTEHTHPLSPITTHKPSDLSVNFCGYGASHFFGVHSLKRVSPEHKLSSP